MLLEDIESDDDIVIVIEEDEKYVFCRWYVVGDIYEGVNFEFLKCLFLEVVKFYKLEKLVCLDKFVFKVMVKIRWLFLMVLENEMLKFNGFCLYVRRNGVLDILEKL